jgi:hypothetical protein
MTGNRQAIAEQDRRSPARLTCGRGRPNTLAVDIRWGRNRPLFWRGKRGLLVSNNPRLPIAARTPRSLAGESKDSGAEIGCTRTAAPFPTHQRARQAVCGLCPNCPAAIDCAHTVQTHPPATCGKARLAAICGPRPHDRKSHDGRSDGTSAAANLTFNLVRIEQYRGRARGNQASGATQEFQRNAYVFQAKDRCGVVGTGDKIASSIGDLLISFRAFSLRIQAAFQSGAALTRKSWASVFWRGTLRKSWADR